LLINGSYECLLPALPCRNQTANQRKLYVHKTRLRLETLRFVEKYGVQKANAHKFFVGFATDWRFTDDK
jgi:hypothetical protein